ncbi:uncharacterized protein [Cardiocondyla obscurior]|uniref:uncharacterized protein n=1 Tax=Cardiocondyla obscurior TaxID=286306 RepID=UPI0039655BAB
MLIEDEESRLLDSAFPMSSRVQERADKMEEEFLDSGRNAPSRDLACTILRNMSKVLRISCVSKGLKGHYAKALKEAACRTRTYATTMLTRMDSGSSNGATEALGLITDLQEAQYNNQKLQEEIKALKQQISEQSPKSPVYKKRKEDTNKELTPLAGPSGLGKQTSAPSSENSFLKKKVNRLTINKQQKSVPIMEDSSEKDEEKPPEIRYLDALFHKWCSSMQSTGKKLDTSSAGNGKPADTNVSISNKQRKTGINEPAKWTKVLGSKAKNKKKKEARIAKNNPTSVTIATTSKTSKTLSATIPKKPTVKKPPKTAAVTITCTDNKYHEILKLAKERINIDKLGITHLRSKRGLTGSIIYEITGDNNKEKAQRLAKEMSTVLKDKPQVRINCPIKVTSLRIRDLDDATTSEDIITAVEKSTGSNRNKFTVGKLRLSYNGLYTAVIKCPLAEARKLVEQKTLRINWLSARIEVLPERPLQCFRCLQKGHVREKCTAPTDRSQCCFRCGETGHQAVNCTKDPCCQICKDAKKPFRHKLGGPACKAPPIVKTKVTLTNTKEINVSTNIQSISESGKEQEGNQLPPVLTPNPIRVESDSETDADRMDTISDADSEENLDNTMIPTEDATEEVDMTDTI